MSLLCGSSGFSFKEWKGPFYPEDLPAGDMLEYYASRLPTVEINNTFYRMPRRELLEGWAQKVPESFRFAVKAPRRITHSKKLKNCAQEIGWLYNALDALGTQLGIVLFQLPPHAQVDTDSLDAFLEELPTGQSAAFEFRHPSWRDDRVLEILSRFGAAWVVTDTDGTETAAIPSGSANAYLRLRADGYADDILSEWKERCAEFSQAYVFFKHEDGGAAPKLAERMLSL